MEFSISSERQKSTCHKLPVWKMTENDQNIRETDLSQERAHDGDMIRNHSVEKDLVKLIWKLLGYDLNLIKSLGL